MNKENELIVSNNYLSTVPQTKIDKIIGSSASMSHLIEMIIRIAPSNLSVLITGESGVGKQVVAEAIHSSSKREGAFIDTHCASFSPTLLEDELFGHEKGAFTGAITSKKGIFEKADKGTLFLDEIGEIDQSVQVKLLKVLEQKRFSLLGSDKVIKSDFRLICATNRDLKREVEEGRFREDLYYRINKFTIEVPPLRERKSDIMALSSSFLKKYSLENNKEIDGFTTEAYNCLLQYKWPGNIRELQNVIEASVVLADSKYIELKDLPTNITDNHIEHKINSVDITEIEESPLTKEENTITIEQDEKFVSIKLGTLKEMEKELIKATLDYYGGNKTRAAEALGINRKTLLSHQ